MQGVRMGVHYTGSADHPRALEYGVTLEEMAGLIPRDAMLLASAIVLALGAVLLLMPVWLNQLLPHLLKMIVRETKSS
jgi:hypothetical protein